MRFRYEGSESVTVPIDRDQLGEQGRRGFEPNKEAATHVVEAFASVGIDIAPSDVDAGFIKQLFSASREGSAGLVKKKAIPDGILAAIEASASGEAVAAPISMRDVLAATHAPTMEKVQACFHGEVAPSKRYMLALNIRSTEEREFVAKSLGIPAENVLNLRDSGAFLSQAPSPDNRFYVGRTGAKIQDRIRAAMAGKTGCSVTVLAHFDAGGVVGPMGRQGEKPTNVGGIPADRLGSALCGGCVDGGHLNFFVCGAHDFAGEVAEAAGVSDTDITAVSNGVALQPHKVGGTPAFFYAGPPLVTDGGRGGDAPRDFDEARHRDISGVFRTGHVD